MTIRIAVCDDEAAQREWLRRLLLQWAQTALLQPEIYLYTSAEELLFAKEGHAGFDLALLDIQLGSMDGITLAKELRKGDPSLQIIFITAYPDFAVEGYEVEALHYLMKPVGPEKLKATLDRALQRINQPRPSLWVRTPEGQVRILLEELFFAEAVGHDVMLHMREGAIEARISINELEEQLHEGFFRCQRSFIVNLKYVHRIDRSLILLDNGQEVPLSRKLYHSVQQAFIRYFYEVEYALCCSACLDLGGFSSLGGVGRASSLYSAAHCRSAHRGFSNGFDHSPLWRSAEYIPADARLASRLS